MDRRRFIALAGAAACAPAFAQSSALTADDIAKLRDFIAATMLREKILGVSIALVDDANIVWSEGFGFADAARSKPVLASSLFNLQSISKTYTATLFLRGVDRGWFGLDDRLVDHLPDFRVHSRFDADDYRRITFRQLLSHWAGLLHEAPVGSNFDDRDCTFEEHIASIKDTWLIAPPGERYAYSNLGLDLIAYVLEKRAGKPFAQHAQEDLLAPLGMTSSTYDRATAVASPHLVRGQMDNGGDVAVFPQTLGAGGLYSTCEDMAKFVIAQLPGGKQLLQPATLRAMRTPQFPVDHQTCGYGLGLFTRPTYGGTTFMHGGGGYGYDTWQRWIPEYGIGAVVLTNEDGYTAEDIADEALRTMIKRKLGHVPETPRLKLTDRPAVASDPANLKALEGTYRAYSGLRTFVVINGALRYRAGHLDLPLTDHGDGDFTADNERFRFHRETDSIRVDDLGDEGVDTFIANELAGEPPGPAKPEWSQFTGDYEAHVWGETATVSVTLRNGYLFVSRDGGTKLLEYAPGFFFTVWGESVTFADGTMIYGNRKFVRKA